MQINFKQEYIIKLLNEELLQYKNINEAKKDENKLIIDNSPSIQDKNKVKSSRHGGCNKHCT